MSSPPSEPFFENQLGYHQYREEQGLPPMPYLDLHGKVASEFENVPDSEEEHGVKDRKDGSETEDECKLYVAVILF